LIDGLCAFVKGLYADFFVVHPLKPILETKKLSGLVGMTSLYKGSNW